MGSDENESRVARAMDSPGDEIEAETTHASGSTRDSKKAVHASDSTCDRKKAVCASDSTCDRKKAVRAQVLKRRDAMSEDTRHEKCERICLELSRMLDDAIEQHGKSAHVPVIAAYSAMHSEVNVGAFLQIAFERRCTVALPCMVRTTGDTPPSTPTPAIKTSPTRTQMQMRLVSSDAFNSITDTFINHPLKTYSSDDLQLSDFPLCNPQSIDFAVVPLVAFDDARNRLGYGGGNYDCFLSLLRSDAVVVGVAFSEQHVDAIPLEPHDLPLPTIIAF